tara:strand:- start:73 stop:399 length:327 start_codon:yes stop_codon:yes gene_type:complete
MTETRTEITSIEFFDVLFRRLYASLYCDSCGWEKSHIDKSVTQSHIEHIDQSHIEHSMRGYGLERERGRGYGLDVATRCKYMDSKYEIWISSDGHLLWKETIPASITE